MNDYYKNESHVDRIPYIKTPSLFMFTQDDCLLPISLVPKKKYLTNENIFYTEFKTGSHLGLYSGLYPQKWYPKLVCDFFCSLDTILIK